MCPGSCGCRTDTKDIEVAVQQCGSAFLRALQDLRVSDDDDIDLDEFGANFGRYLEEERGS